MKVSKWQYTNVSGKIVMTRVNYDKDWIETRKMTIFETVKYQFGLLWRNLTMFL